jgi:monofunctional biosynthetic peptidoglycan transglycosylase
VTLRRRIARIVALSLFAFVAATLLPVLLLRWVDPWSSAFMLDARIDALLARDWAYGIEYRFVPLEDISPHAAMAVIAAEDQQFAFHAGFDFESMRKAINGNVRGGKVRGASTLTQQVAKNLFLWQGRSYLRKGLEAWFTVLIELSWPKDRILEVYVNIAEFGPGVYGVEAAARRYFGKPARRLTRRESAALAAVLPSPRRYRVQDPGPYVARRREWIVKQMRALGGPKYLEILDDDEPMLPASKR